MAKHHESGLPLLGNVNGNNLQNQRINHLLTLPAYNEPSYTTQVIPNTINQQQIPQIPLLQIPSSQNQSRLNNNTNNQHQGQSKQLVDEYLQKIKSRSKIKRNQWILGYFCDFLREKLGVNE
eukprot:406_1